MAENVRLLEAALAEALRRASDEPFPDAAILPAGAEALRTERGVVRQIIDSYRKHSAALDAAVTGLNAFLDRPDAAARVRALERAVRDRQPARVRHAIADRIFESDELRPLRTASDTAGIVASELGISGDAFYFLGIGGGYEKLRGDTVEYRERVWAELDLQYRWGVTVGLNYSFWWAQPVRSIIFGGVLELGQPPGTKMPLAMHVVIFGQYSLADKTFEFAGILVQVGAGKIKPTMVAGGIFVGLSWPYDERHLSLVVKETEHGTDSITVDTPATLQVTITANVDLEFDEGATMTLSMPSYFTEEDLEAMSIPTPPDGWDVVADGTRFVFTANTGVSWSKDETIQFDIDNVESAGTTGAGDVQKGFLVLTVNPSSTLPAEAQAQLSLVWQQFSASLTWTASAGTSTDHLILGGDCTNDQTSCSGGPVTAYSQNSYDVTCLVPATDPNDNDKAYELGYQFNYADNGDGTYTPHVRAVVWESATDPALATWTGDWVPYGSAAGTETTAKFRATNGETQITIAVTF